MNTFDKKYNYLLLVLIFVHFFIFPYFGNIDKNAKIYFIVLSISLFLFFYIRKNIKVYFSIYSAFLLILISFLVLSSYYSFSPFWSFSALGVLSFAILFAFLTCDLSLKNDNFFRDFTISVMFLGVVSSVLGLYEFVHFIVLGPSNEMLVPYILPPNLSIRVGSVYGQPNLFALVLTITIICFFYWFLCVEKKSKNNTIEILKYLPFLLVCYVFFLTQSRAGFLSLSLIALISLWPFFSKRFFIQSKFRRRNMFILIFILFLSFVLYKITFTYVSRDLGEINVASISTSIRFLLWMSSLLIFFDNPFLGIGLDNFRFLQSSYNELSHSKLGFVPYEAMGSTPWAHNEILQLLCETGLIVTLLTIFFFIMLSKNFYRLLQDKSHKNKHDFIFCNIMLLPFVFQSQFSWPLRHPALLFLFFGVLGVVLSHYKVLSIRISVYTSIMFKISLIFVLLVVFWFIFYEIKIGHLRNQLSDKSEIESSFISFEKLVQNPYSKYRVLRSALPVYVREALAEDGLELTRWVLPYCREVVVLEGARWQWYDLARIYLKLDDLENSRIAIQKVIDLKPSDDMAWSFLHYLNMIKASHETGRPLEDFLPIPPGGVVEELEGSFDFDD